MTNTKTEKNFFDTRIVTRGSSAAKLHKALIAKKKKENRNTIINTATAALLEHFGIAE